MTKIRDLENEIERLVREHVAACKAAAAAAVERGFGPARTGAMGNSKSKTARLESLPSPFRVPSQVSL